MVQDELTKIENLQVEIDSDAETYNLSNACQGEVALLMGTRL